MSTVESVAALVVVGLFVAAAALWALYRTRAEEAPSRYQMFTVITTNHKPARSLPIDLSYPTIPETRDIAFHMLEAGCPPVVRVIARNLSVREWKEITGML